MKAIGYIQIRAERTPNGYLTGCTPVRLTKGPPAHPESDSIVIKVEFDVPANAFEPYLAQAEVPEGIKDVPMTVEDPHD